MALFPRFVTLDYNGLDLTGWVHLVSLPTGCCDVGDRRCGSTTIIRPESRDLRFRLVRKQLPGTIPAAWSVPGNLQVEYTAVSNVDDKEPQFYHLENTTLADADLGIFTASVPAWSSLYFRLRFTNITANSIPSMTGFEFETL